MLTNESNSDLEEAQGSPRDQMDTYRLAYIEGKVFFVCICISGMSENGGGGRAPNLPPRFRHSCTGYSLSDISITYLLLVNCMTNLGL